MMICGAAGGVASLLNSAAAAAASTAAAVPSGSAALAPGLVASSTVTTAMLPQLACAVLVVLAVGQLLGQVHGVFRSGFSESSISEAVDACVKPIGLALIVMAAMA